MKKEGTADLYERDPPPQSKTGTNLKKVDFGQFRSLFSQIFTISCLLISIFCIIWVVYGLKLCSDHLSMIFLPQSHKNTVVSHLGLILSTSFIKNVVLRWSEQS